MAVRAVKVSLTGESLTNFKSYLSGNLEAVVSSMDDFHNEKLPAYRRLYEAVPENETRTFPFENASNLVIPIVAIHVDTLLARVMSAILKMRPIWPVKITGDFDGKADGMRAALEDYLTEQAIEPEAFNLYEVYKPWFKDAINTGLGVVKMPWETEVESEVVVDRLGKVNYIDSVKYDGPRPQRLLLEDFFIRANDVSISNSWFKAHRRRLTRSELEWRVARGLYDGAIITKILGSPTRMSSEGDQAERESDVGMLTVQDDYGAQYDIYECHMKYQIGDHLVRVIASYHKDSDSLLRAVYTPFPDDCFEGATLFPRDGVVVGYGFAEILSNIEEEISQTRNQRRDAQTVANAKVFRVNPNSPLNAGYKIYPGAKLPGEEGEIEAISHGEPSPFQVDEERLMLDLAERRTGVTPPMQGYGAGQAGKRGVYSAIATLSLLQEGNSRGDLNVSDLRAAHMRLGRKLTRQIAEFGLSQSRFAGYGKHAELIYNAFDAVKKGSVKMPILAATAALNNEVEKQSDMILVGVLRQHYAATTQMLMQLQQQMLPQDVRDYVTQTVKAADALMRMIVRHFGYDDVSRLVPEALKGADEGASQTQQPSNQLARLPSGSSVPGLGGNGTETGFPGPGKIQ